MNDHMRVYSPAEVDTIIAAQRANAKEGVLIGLIAAATSGAVMGMLILLAVQAMFP